MRNFRDEATLIYIHLVSVTDEYNWEVHFFLGVHYIPTFFSDCAFSFFIFPTGGRRLLWQKTEVLNRDARAKFIFLI